MREEKKIFILFLILSAIGVISLIVSSNLFNISLFLKDLYISSYQCEIEVSRPGIKNPELILLKIHEEYNYVVKGRKKMLFRYWEVPLVPMKDVGANDLSDFSSREECIILLGLESKSGIVYAKDNKGNVYSKRLVDQGDTYILPQPLVEEIEEEAYTNEVGIVSRKNLGTHVSNLQYFDEGEYSLSITYLTYFKYRTDKYNSHVNIKLANQHIPYRKVKIVVKDNEGVIMEIYPHLSSKPFLSTLFLANKDLPQTLSDLFRFSLRKEGNTYTVEGISPQDKIIGFVP